MILILDIKQNFLTKNRCYIQHQKRKPIGIQIHTIGCAQGTAKSVADYWNQSGVSAAVTYIVDADVSGRVLQTLPEDVYSWADAGYGNRNLITIEICESDFMKYTSGANYTVTDEIRFREDILRGYDTAVALCVDICKRYKWDPETKLSSGLYLISSHNEGRIAGLSSAHVDPSHIWPRLGLSMDTFRKAVKAGLKQPGSLEPVVEDVKYYRVRKTWTDISSQIGAYEVKDNAVNSCPPGYHVYDWNGKCIYTNKEETSGTQASDFEGLSETVAAKRILDLVRSTDKSGILYSVTAAQAILESGYVTTSLSKSANNIFGMKTSLSGNTWDSVWDGKTYIRSLTWEHRGGVDVQEYADFRKYPCLEDSIKDHSAYLLGAKNGDKLRYAHLLEAKDYTQAITIIKNGGYATDPNYISKICSIIQRFGLDAYDPKPIEPVPTKTYYYIQVGAYKSEANANKKAAEVKKTTNWKCDVVNTKEGSYPYKVMCGKFSAKVKAEVRKKELKDKYGIDSCIKT